MKGMLDASLRKIMPCRTCLALLSFVCPAALFAQQSFTWTQLRDKFEATNPTLRALQIGIDQSSLCIADRFAQGRIRNPCFSGEPRKRGGSAGRGPAHVG